MRTPPAKTFLFLVGLWFDLFLFFISFHYNIKKQSIWRCMLTISPFVLFLLPGEEIENSNPDFFAGCCDQLQISQTTAYVKFKDLADELFKDQENGQRGKIRRAPKKLWRGIFPSMPFCCHIWKGVIVPLDFFLSGLNKQFLSACIAVSLWTYVVNRLNIYICHCTVMHSNCYLRCLVQKPFRNTITSLTQQGFFSKFLMGGDSKFSVPVSPQRGWSRMGGGDLKKKIRLKPKLPT